MLAVSDASLVKSIRNRSRGLHGIGTVQARMDSAEKQNRAPSTLRVGQDQDACCYNDNSRPSKTDIAAPRHL